MTISRRKAGVSTKSIAVLDRVGELEVATEQESVLEGERGKRNILFSSFWVGL